MKFNRDDLVIDRQHNIFGTIVGWKSDSVYTVQEIGTDDTYETHEKHLGRAKKKPVRNLGDYDMHRKKLRTW